MHGQHLTLYLAGETILQMFKRKLEWCFKVRYVVVNTCFLIITTLQEATVKVNVFCVGSLNASDAENLLGYEIYSCALADILSDPSLITPITVGLYAKWGSGKSFLLGKLTGQFTVHTSFKHYQDLMTRYMSVFIATYHK